MADVDLARDDALLATLGAVLSPLPAEPPVASVAALRASAQMLARDGRQQGVLTRAAAHWRRIAAGGGIVVGVLAGGTGVAFASGSVPEPVRAVAYDLGLPVDSPALSAARHDESRLRHALSQVSPGDRGSAATASADAQAMAQQLARLDRGDRSRIGTEPLALITQARSVESRFGLEATALPGTRPGGTQGPASAERPSPGGSSSGPATSGTTWAAAPHPGGGTAPSGGGVAGSRAPEGDSPSGGTGQDGGNPKGTEPGPGGGAPGASGTGSPSNGQAPPPTGGQESGRHGGFRGGDG